MPFPTTTSKPSSVTALVLASSDCVPYTSQWSDPSHHPLTVSIFASLYTIVFVLGLFGNLSVVLATCRQRNLQSVQNIFIVNLAISGVITCLLSIPLTPVTTMFKQWFFGAALCRIVGATQAVGLFIGTFSLCAIAIDRYFRLVIAPGRPLRKASAIRITIVMWIVAIAATIPYVYHMEIKTYEGICGEFCTEAWPNNSSKRSYTLLVLAIQFVIPFGIMTVCYHAVFSFLRKRATNRLTSITHQANLLYVVAATAGGDSQQHKDQLTHLIEQKNRVLNQRRRVTVILVSMVVIFGLTALPHNVLAILTEFHTEDEWSRIGGEDLSYLISLCTHFMMMISCITNPLLYAFLNPEFRDFLRSGMRWAPLFVSRSFAPTQTSVL